MQQQFPGFVFTLGGAVDAHHDQARFSWHLGPAGAEPVVIGFDVAVLDGGGQIAQRLRLPGQGAGRGLRPPAALGTGRPGA